MHKLARQVRFSINPFGPAEGRGFNSYASNPAGEGLSLYFSLWVELAGNIEPDTGFIINVTEIDKAVRESAVPLFRSQVCERFAAQKAISFAGIGQMLKSARQLIQDRLGKGEIENLKLELNPARSIAISTKKPETMLISEKFEFAATHTLWNSDFSPERNFEVFGKCANPTGHGHNYVVEVCLNVPIAKEWMGIGAMERIVDENFIALVDHKNLNVDLDEFKKLIPTVENIAIVAWQKLAAKFEPGMLDCINVWETDKTYCSYRGS